MSPPDLNLLRGISQENLSAALRVLRGKKVLVIEPSLTPTLDLIANYQFLKNLGVIKILHLESASLPPPAQLDNCNRILYFIRSDLVSAKIVCDQINSNLAQGIVEFKYGVVVIPRRLHVITALFESEGVYNEVEFGQYSYEMIPLDEHILSLQFDDMVQNLWLHHETSYLPTVAKCIFNLRGVYGDFHHLIAIGGYSTAVVNLMNEFEVIHQTSLKSHNQRVSDLPTIILIDRSMDFVSPLLTSMTYEGMLDEIFGIKGKTITFGPDVTGKDTVKHVLNSSDPVFEKVRNLHFSQVVKQLIAQTKDLKKQKDESSGMNVKAMKSFVEKDLKKIQTMQKTASLHFGAMDVIIKEKAAELKKLMDLEDNILDGIGHKETQGYFEDCIAKGVDPTTVLRLFCLSTLAQDGLRECKSLKTQFIQSYGFKEIFTLHHLEQMGLMYPFKGLEANAKGVAQVFTRVANSSSLSGAGAATKKTTPGTPFQTVLKKLVPPANVDINLEVPDHPSYIFNGKYTPFVAKIAEEILSIAPKTNTELISKRFDELMKFYHISESVIKCKASSTSGSEAYARGKNALVFVIGGITRSEIAALQLISMKLGFNIICGGTDITNGKKIVNAAMSAA